MKATFNSDRNEGSVINLTFKEGNEADKAKAEKIGNWLVEEYGFEWITEEEDMMTVGVDCWTIAEMKEVYKAAKEATR